MTDAIHLRSPAWVALPDDDEEEAAKTTTNVISISASMWSLTTSVFILATMLFKTETLQILCWLVVIICTEACMRFMYMKSTLKPKPHSRLRHFTSMRLIKDAPIEEIVARFLTLDTMSEVHFVHFIHSCFMLLYIVCFILFALYVFTGSLTRTGFEYK